MVSYSTNMMGPWHTSWYVERGLTRKASRIVSTGLITGYSIGDTLEYDEVVTHYAGGRIDIYGLPEGEYYGGKHEYSLPVMKGTSWNVFSDWLDNLSTKELISYKEIIQRFQTETKHKIEWWDE